jgi:lysyl-tRNA synthetase class 2
MTDPVMNNWPLAMRKKTLEQRARILHEIRKFFIDQAYLEVETPCRIPAPAPEAYINAIASGSWFLHTSPELCMKRLLAAGYGKIFQICRCWREGERGNQHIPEFTLLEWYRSGTDYRGLMQECQALIQAVAKRIDLGPKITYRDQEIDLSNPWEKISVKEAFSRYAQSSAKEAIERNLFDDILIQEIEPRLGIGKPTFIYDYPAERAALARLKPDDITVAERFELYIGGLEVANGFSELVDEEEQRRRFQLENANRRRMGKPIYPMPEKFLTEMDSMPPSAGIALGVDRLVMVLLNAAAIDEVVAFTPEEL